MVQCKRIPGVRRQICVGDLDRQIIVQTRAIGSPSGSSVDYSEGFTDLITVWAMIRTTRGSQLFDGVEISNPFTHLFYIRFISGVTFENWVEFADEKYDIVDTEILDERNEFTVLRCTKRGDKDKDANTG